MNFNAVKTVITASLCLYELALEIGNNLVDEILPNRKAHLKEFYSKCAKLYLLDFMIYVSMHESRLDIFYKPVDDERWITMRENIELFKAGDEQSI